MSDKTLDPGTHFLCAQKSLGLLIKDADSNAVVLGGPRNLHIEQLLGTLLQLAYRLCFEKPCPDPRTASLRGLALMAFL